MNFRDLAGPLGKKLRDVTDRYKYCLLVILIGFLLLALPGQKNRNPTDVSAASGSGQNAFDLKKMEEKLEHVLSKIEGAGKVTVVLTVKTGTRQVLAEDGEIIQKSSDMERSSSTVVLSKGSGSQEVVSVQEIFPQFQGALVVCAGGNSPAVKLKLVEAVSALTGLGSDKISICKGK